MRHGDVRYFYTCAISEVHEKTTVRREWGTGDWNFLEDVEAEASLNIDMFRGPLLMTRPDAESRMWRWLLLSMGGKYNVHCNTISHRNFDHT